MSQHTKHNQKTGAQVVWKNSQIKQKKKQKLKARTLTLKVKYANFKQVTRAHTSDEVFNLRAIKNSLPKLLAKTEAGKSPVRLVGLSLSGFDKNIIEKKQNQLDLNLNDNK